MRLSPTILPPVKLTGGVQHRGFWFVGGKYHWVRNGKETTLRKAQWYVPNIEVSRDPYKSHALWPSNILCQWWRDSAKKDFPYAEVFYIRHSEGEEGCGMVTPGAHVTVLLARVGILFLTWLLTGCLVLPWSVLKDKTIKLWKITERDKRPEGYNLKDEEGKLKDLSTVTSLQVSLMDELAFSIMFYQVMRPLGLLEPGSGSHHCATILRVMNKYLLTPDRKLMGTRIQTLPSPPQWTSEFIEVTYRSMSAVLQGQKWFKDSCTSIAHFSMCDNSKKVETRNIQPSIQAVQQSRVFPFHTNVLNI